MIGRAPDKLISIVCIAGPYRLGKSFLLNIFLQYLKNGDEDSDDWIETPVKKPFQYSKSSRPVTSGIWLWSEPFVIKNAEGRDIAVFLMDSQGWHDSKSPLADNALLFGLSTLLSSVMIYNVDKKLDEPDLQFLQSFAFEVLPRSTVSGDTVSHLGGRPVGRPTRAGSLLAGDVLRGHVPRREFSTTGRGSPGGQNRVVGRRR